MASEYRGNKKNGGGGNRLVTSPKGVKICQTQSVVANSIIANGYNHIDIDAEEIFFSKVTFCDACTVVATTKNRLIVFEACNFHDKVTFYGNAGTRIMMRNCNFRENITISSVEAPEFTDCGVLQPETKYSFFQKDIYMQDQETCN